MENTPAHAGRAWAPGSTPGSTRRLVTGVAALLLIVATGCSTSRNNDIATKDANNTESTQANDNSTDTSPDSAAPASSSPDTTEPPVTEAATTDVPPTEATETVPPTDAPTTQATAAPTTAPSFPAGWRDSPKPFDANLFPPFDESNWTGVPSPALPTASGQPLADGIYDADVTTPWVATDPTHLEIEVKRLDPCTALPDDACISFGDPYGPGELGVDDAHPYPVTITLDASIGVGMTGYKCGPVDKTANGADMAALFGVFDTAYTATIAPLVLASGAQEDAINRLTTAPAGGFHGADANCAQPNAGGGLVFEPPASAPPILLQIVGNVDVNNTVTTETPLTPTDAIHLDTILVKDGKVSLYWYAGFYS